MTYRCAAFKKHLPLITSVVYARLLFYLVNDPEGPNLLVVAVASLCIYGGMFGGVILVRKLYALLQKNTPLQGSNHDLLFRIGVQAIVTLFLYYLLQYV